MSRISIVSIATVVAIFAIAGPLAAGVLRPTAAITSPENFAVAHVGAIERIADTASTTDTAQVSPQSRKQVRMVGPQFFPDEEGVIDLRYAGASW